MVEGIAEATALIIKVLCGALSDCLGQRAGLAVLDFALGVLTIPVFALGGGVEMRVPEPDGREHPQMPPALPMPPEPFDSPAAAPDRNRLGR